MGKRQCNVQAASLHAALLGPFLLLAGWSAHGMTEVFVAILNHDARLGVETKQCRSTGEKTEGVHTGPGLTRGSEQGRKHISILFESLLALNLILNNTV